MLFVDPRICATPVGPLGATGGCGGVHLSDHSDDTGGAGPEPDPGDRYRDGDIGGHAGGRGERHDNTGGHTAGSYNRHDDAIAGHGGHFDTHLGHAHRSHTNAAAGRGGDHTAHATDGTNGTAACAIV